MTPMGNFHTPLSGGKAKKYILFAGGSGITPMMSIIKSVLYVEKQSQITLIYGNKDEASTIFKKEIDELSSKNSQLKIVYVFDSPLQKINDLQTGIISLEKTKEQDNSKWSLIN